MNDADKDFAREALQRKWLTIDQVDKCRAVSETSGRPIREIAETYGFFKPAPPRTAHRFTAVLLVTLVLFAAGTTWVAVDAIRRSRQADLDSALLHAQIQSQPPPPQRPTGVREQIAAEKRLQDARAAMRYVEENFKTLAANERTTRLEEAVDDFTGFLKSRPDFTPALCDRGQALEMLGRIAEALHDYEDAVKRDPAYKDILYNRIADLRHMLEKK